MPHQSAPCPGCGVPLPYAVRACPRCRLPLEGPLAAELWQVDRTLSDIDQRRTGLLHRRAELLAALRALTVVQMAAPVPRAAGPVWGLPGQAPAAARPKRDASPPTVQNMLLALGGVLLTVAAVAFTVVSWGHLGIGGRAAVLLAMTLIALAVPVRLMRRELAATAEAVAGLGLALAVLDTYAARHTGLAGLDSVNGPGYAAVCLAVLSVGWAYYGRRVGLRLAAPTALVLAQLPFNLLASALTPGVHGMVTGLLATAALDAAVGLAVRPGGRAVRVIAAAAGAVFGLSGTVTALVLSFRTDAVLDAAEAAALLAAGAALALGSAHRLPKPTAPRGARPDADTWSSLLAAVAGIALIAAVGGLGRTVLHADWRIVGYLAAAVAALGTVAFAASRTGFPKRLSTGLAAAAAAVHTAVLLWAAPALATAVAAPLGWGHSAWDGAPRGSRAALSPELVWPGSAAVAVVLATTAAVLAAASQWSGPADERTADEHRTDERGADARTAGARPTGRRSARLVCAAIAMGAATAAVAPLALDLPYTLAVPVLVLSSGALLAASALVARTDAARTCLAAGTAMAATASGWSLAERPMTLAALGLLLTAFAASAFLANEPAVRATATSGAVLAATGLAWAGPLALGVPAHGAAFAVLAVRAGCLALAAVPALRGRVESTALDFVGTVPALLAIGLAVPGEGAGPVTALAALCAVAAAWLRPGQWRGVALTESAALAALAPLLSAPALVEALARPFRPLDAPWSGASDMAAGAMTSASLLLAAVVLLSAVCAVLAAAVAGGRAWAETTTCSTAPVVLVVVTGSTGLPYPAAPACVVMGAAALFAVAAARKGMTALVASAAALSATAAAATWSLAERSATLIVLAAATVLAAGCAARARSAPVRAQTACAAVSAACAEAAALSWAVHPVAAYAAFPVLAVAAATVPLAARLRARPEGVPIEVTGYAAAVAAVALTAHDTALLALSLALTGVIALGTAIRRDRRRAACAGTVLLVLAAWIRLADSSVHAPEAYSLPVTVAALLVGWLRRRKDPALSSWTAYAPGLGATMLPSLAAAWTDPDWPRPLLLGTAALAVTLAGARYRLRAPLLLGAGVLALVAAHELAPTVIQVVDRLPRWVPPALAGALLLAVGATYEHRLRDIRRLRGTLGRMS
ncbi:SCO7613 C-terminal domain-containing membrane protein [Wenjunlia tyrosinilytica]|uniref:Uncharacterized protein n=1 Tax=Wenjunlia tyrosinilytica TaxID=1544741 RepID=A0A917ZGW6_9ACTN|nr:hypothetical protein [Wenjunlia tyrosinilytica]GGO82523.1 hypothetical protein GCM10012280_09320 [Wenjunlia tyrosinilytica]